MCINYNIMTKCNGCFEQGKKLKDYWSEKLCKKCLCITHFGETYYDMDDSKIDGFFEKYDDMDDIEVEEWILYNSI